MLVMMQHESVRETTSGSWDKLYLLPVSGL